MKRSQITVGNVYVVKVSGKLAPVKITHEREGTIYSMTSRTVRKFMGVNQLTGRVIGPFTAAKCRFETVLSDKYADGKSRWVRA